MGDGINGYIFDVSARSGEKFLIRNREDAVRTQLHVNIDINLGTSTLKHVLCTPVTHANTHVQAVQVRLPAPGSPCLAHSSEVGGAAQMSHASLSCLKDMVDVGVASDVFSTRSHLIEGSITYREDASGNLIESISGLSPSFVESIAFGKLKVEAK